MSLLQAGEAVHRPSGLYVYRDRLAGQPAVSHPPSSTMFSRSAFPLLHLLSSFFLYNSYVHGQYSGPGFQTTSQGADVIGLSDTGNNLVSLLYPG